MGSQENWSGMSSKQEVQKYLEEHKLEQLFRNATAAVIYEQPDDPKKFLASFFRDLIAARDGHAPGVSPTIVNEENIVSMYETIDVNNTGYITFNQYKEVMGNLGIVSFNSTPAGHAGNKIYREIFLQEARAGLVASAATYASYHG